MESRASSPVDHSRSGYGPARMAGDLRDHPARDGSHRPGSANVPSGNSSPVGWVALEVGLPERLPYSYGRSMDASEPVGVDLTAEEIRLVTAGLVEWGGPARCTDALAVAMGFVDVKDLFRQSKWLVTAIRSAEPLSPRDWTRALLATEIVFASDVLGSGSDWVSTVGWSDEKTIHVLRQLQSKLLRARVLTPKTL
jgi:hypothetical protein